MNICEIPSEILYKQCRKVLHTDHMVEYVRDMISLMRKNDGLGLAAPQVGLDLRCFVVEVSSQRANYLENNKVLKHYPGYRNSTFGPLCFINPEIIDFSTETSYMVEGCLSIPNYSVNICRSDAITIKAFNITGKEFTWKCAGLLSRVIQHEYDHLNGRLITHFQG